MTQEEFKLFQKMDGEAEAESVKGKGWAWAARGSNGWVSGTAADLPDNTLKNVKENAWSGLSDPISYVIYFKGKLMDSAWNYAPSSAAPAVHAPSQPSAPIPPTDRAPRSASRAALVVRLRDASILTTAVTHRDNYLPLLVYETGHREPRQVPLARRIGQE